ncbi:transposase [Dietzia sp. CW19]|nr:transposase [Dietzia sp. CW19]
MSPLHRRAAGTDRAPVALQLWAAGASVSRQPQGRRRHHLPLPAGIPRRDLPHEEFGPWQTVWKRHARYAEDGTWDRVLQTTLAEADAAELIDWNVSVDAPICRAHQHRTSSIRAEQDTGRSVESRESPRRRA